MSLTVIAITVVGSLLCASPAWAGFNNDGHADALFANYGQQPTVCLGDGNGGFSCGDISTPSDPLANNVALGDLNGDGKVDTVIAVEWQSLFTVCLGNGAGGFTCDNIDTDWNHFLGVALGDVNADGNLDALFANYALPDQVCLGNGAGGFACSNVSSDELETYSVALADLDSDGDLDAVFANRVGNDRVCLGDGTGRFSCSDVKVDSVELHSFDVELGDLNGDGALDAVFSDCSRPIKPHRACFGDGAGGFSSCSAISPSRTEDGCSYGTALGDFNGDGDLDAVFSENTPTDKDAVCLGDGIGHFTCSDVSSDSTPDHDVAVSDVNGDGALDAVFANYYSSQTCLGDGVGGFSCTALSANARNSRGVALVPGGSRRNPAAVGVWRPSTGQFLLDANGNGRWDGTYGGDRLTGVFGTATDLPVTGDWNDDGYEEVGFWRPGDRRFRLDANANDRWDGPAGGDTLTASFGAATDLPVSGDWDGDGRTEVGVWRPSLGLFLLDLNANGCWDGVAGGDRTSRFGAAGDRPVAGDWDGDGRSEVGVWRPATGRFLLDVNGNGRWDGSAGGDILTGWFGLPGDRPAIGDWTGDGPEEVGFWRPDDRRFRLDANANDRWDGPSGGDRVTAAFGAATDVPVAGRW
jgi:hypothetical protein